MALIAPLFTPPAPCPLAVPLSRPAWSPPGLWLGRSLAPWILGSPLPSRGARARLGEPGWASAGREQGPLLVGGHGPPVPVPLRVTPRPKGSISV